MVVVLNAVLTALFAAPLTVNRPSAVITQVRAFYTPLSLLRRPRPFGRPDPTISSFPRRRSEIKGMKPTIDL